ncbi:22731_t:CDS:2, partial [Entrophospora sp. SA101]
ATTTQNNLKGDENVVDGKDISIKEVNNATKTLNSFNNINNNSGSTSNLSITAL